MNTNEQNKKATENGCAAAVMTLVVIMPTAAYFQGWRVLLLSPAICTIAFLLTGILCLTFTKEN